MCTCLKKMLCCQCCRPAKKNDKDEDKQTNEDHNQLLNTHNTQNSNEIILSDTDVVVQEWYNE